MIFYYILQEFVLYFFIFFYILRYFIKNPKISVQSREVIVVLYCLKNQIWINEKHGDRKRMRWRNVCLGFGYFMFSDYFLGSIFSTSK